MKKRTQSQVPDGKAEAIPKPGEGCPFMPRITMIQHPKDPVCLRRQSMWIL